MRVPMLATAAVLICALPALAQTPPEAPAQPPAPAVEAQPQAPADMPAQKPADVPVQPPADVAANKVPSRYSFKRTDDGFLRLDNENGQIAYCSSRTAGWTCQAVPEDRAALEKEIERLQDEVAGLKKEVAALRAPPPLPPQPPPVPKDESRIKLPTREDIDHARAIVEHAWRSLVDMIVNLQKDVMRKG